MKTKNYYIILFLALCLSTAFLKAQTISTSLPVGTTAGEVSITQNGAATYEVPIKLTPGTSGMAPQLSIVYNSQGSDGLLGIGFSISGLSSISRCPKNLDNDGVNAPVNLDDNDRFSLDGNRLILVSGTYGADGSEYRTESNTFVKIKAIGNSNAGPEKFMVWTKSGLIQEYGYTVDSRIEAQGKANVIYWLLDKVTDTKGNYYTITYTEDNATGEYRPLRIDYTGNNNSSPVLSPYNSVQFFYEERSRTSPVFLKGSMSQMTKLLDDIKVYNGQTLAKEYKLTYNFIYVAAAYNLASVTEIGSDGTKYNPTNFEWYTTSSYQHSGHFNDQSYYANAYVNKADIVLGDFNGDGRTDFIATPKPGAAFTGLRLFLANQEGNKCEYTGTATLENGFEKLVTGDFNGDGKTDILQICNYNGFRNCFLYYSTGTGFTSAKVVLSETRNFEVRVGEFSGDGANDLFVYYPGASDCKYIRSEYTNGTLDPLSFTVVQTLPTGKVWDRVETGDFNGDGLTDIFNLDGSGNQLLVSNGYGYATEIRTGTFPDKNHYINFGDFNGDGKTDMLITGWNGYNWDPWQMHLSTGTGFQGFLTQKKFDPTAKQIFVCDMNGDGRDDFFAVEKTGDLIITRIPLYIAGADGTYFTYQDGDMSYSLQNNKFNTGDFNGDGRADYMITSAQDTYTGYSLSTEPTDRSNLVKNITDGMGNVSTITYKPTTNSSVYNKYSNSSYPIIDIQGAFPVVESLTVPDGIGGTKATTYKYEGAKMHKRGKGFLGFTKFTTTDKQTGISSSLINEFEAPYTSPAGFNSTYYMPALKRTETRTSGQKLLSEADYTNTLQTYEAGVFTFMPTTVVEKKYELNDPSSSAISTTSTSYRYDDYGNVLTTSQDFGGEASVSTTNVYTNDVTKWFLGRLTSATVTKKSTGKPDIVRLTQFEYDPTSGILTKEKIEPGNDTLGYEKTYEHDDFGNIIKSTTTAGGKTRYLQSKYDDQGRYVIETTNNLGHKVTKTVHPLFGTITSQTSPDTTTVTTEYDGFGSVTKTTNADGSYSKVTLYWCNGTEGGPSNAVYYARYESSEKPPALEFFDRLGRSVRKVVIGFDGTKIYTNNAYNMRGQVSVASEPYFEGVTPVNSTFNYDDIGRVVWKTLPDNSTIHITYNGLTTTTQNPLGQKEIRKVNQRGLLIESTDNNSKTITYVYNSAGNLIETHKPDGTVIQMEYDILGNRTKLIDPDLGTIKSRYNAFGEMWQESDAKSQTVTNEYDNLGRLVKRTEPEGVTQWVYDAAYKGTGKLISTTGPNSISKSVQYDDLGRVKNQSETIDGITYTTTTSYDAYSRVSQITYPKDPSNSSGLSVIYHYNTNGYLDKVVNASSGLEYWTAQKMNARGQLEQVKYGNNLTTNRTFNSVTGLLEGIQTPGIRNWTYSFNTIGNLLQRKDVTRGITEGFEYDNLNRLTRVTKDGTESLKMTYDDYGNILTKSDVGNYNYGQKDNNPHALLSIDMSGNTIVSQTSQNVTYTSFDKVRTIWQGTDSIIITYGSSYERKQVNTYKNQVLQNQKYYVGILYEKEKNVITGEIKETFYITAGEGVVATFTHNSNGTQSTRYLHKDHLGSIQYITDENGNLAQELSYDAWGNRRDPATWKVYTTLPVGLLLARGFTGHEHLDLFGLINMDGRVYDPSIGRFLSPDITIQDIENMQCFNRYSYCINNPLSLTDPSGYTWLSNNWKSLVAAVVAITVTVVTAGVLAPASWAMITTATVAGAAGGFAGGFTGALLAGGDLGDAFKAGAIGGLIGGASGFLSFAAGSVSSTGTWAIVERAVKHTFAQAWLSGIQGENMMHGALSGLFSSLGGEATWKGEPLGVKIASNAIVGGTASYVGGGKFANGAVTGAYVMMFNHLVNHYREKRYEFSGFKRNGDPNKDTKLNFKSSALYKGYVEIKQKDGRWYAEAFAEVMSVDAGDKPNFYGNIVVTKNGQLDSYDYLTMDHFKSPQLFDGDYTQIGVGAVWLPETGNVNVQITIGTWTWKFWTGSTSHLIYQQTFDPLKK